MAAPSMDELAERFASDRVGGIFLYTNEAHPGEHYPHLTSFEQKLRHSRALRDVIGVRRPILVDALDGPCHRAYGSMPNMTWIFDGRGVSVYKADWTDSESVANALDALLVLPARRREGVRIAPFNVERLEWRKADRKAFFDGLERNGPKAVREFRDAFGGP